MTKSHADQRRHRRKVGGTAKGKQEHKKRVERKKKRKRALALQNLTEVVA